MRTTVTLDPDVERLLKEAMHRNKKSFKKTLNDAVRHSLGTPKSGARRKQFVVKPRPMKMLSGIDPSSLNDVAAELEIEAFKKTTARLVSKKQ